jgi:glycerophosphoryl diester phosphodiesterase
MKKLLVLSAAALALPAAAVDWQGHRGARGLSPENTIGAMETALSYPAVTTLELDVVISKDRKVVVSHEPWMSEEICRDKKGVRAKGRGQNLFQMTAAEIAEFDCGSLPHPRFPQQKKVPAQKPLLDDLLGKFSARPVSFNVEIKSTVEDERDGFQPDVKTFAELVVGVLKARLPVERFTVQCFDWRVLRYLWSAHPELRLVALLEGHIDPDKVLKDLGFAPAVFSPYYKELTRAHVEAFHRRGVKVVPWTVNEPGDMAALVKLGVDGIITDYPDRIPVKK